MFQQITECFRCRSAHRPFCFIIGKCLSGFSLRILHRYTKMRNHSGSAIDQRRYGRNKLDRCNLERLTKWNGCQFYLSDIFLFMHNRCCFSRKIDPGLSQQAELLKIMIKIFCTKAQSQFYKHRITGIHNPLGECLCPVSRCLVTADPAILHDFISRTVKGIVHSHHALFQCRSCSNDLKCRTWFIRIINTGIAPHLIQQILFFWFFQIRGSLHIQRKRLIQIILWYVYHGKNLTILGIH